MSTQTDTHLHRDQLRRQLLRWRIVAVLAVFVVVLIAGLSGERPVAKSDRIQRIWVKNLIVENQRRLDDIAEAVDDDAVKAIVVRIDSPGGTVVGGETLYRALKQAGEVKPVVAVMGTTGTSGAYMTALGAERIFAHEGTLTGSIGVILQSADLRGLLDKIGISPRTYKSGPLKAQPSPFEEESEDVRQATMAVIADMHAQFKAMVATARGLPGDQVEAVANGRIFTGRQALDLGLIDAIGGESEAVAWLESERDVPVDLPVVDVKRDLAAEFVRRLNQADGGKSLISEALGLGLGVDVGLDGLLALWHPEM